MKPIVLNSKKDIDNLVSLLMSVNSIPQGNGIALLLNDFESASNFDAVKRWTLKTLWENSSADTAIVLGELSQQLECVLEKGLLDVSPAGRN